jgi:transposase
MFFSAFNLRRRLPMVPLAGDPESPRGGVTARIILECLQRFLPRIVTRNSYFQHDNASTFTAHIVRDWIYEWCENRRAEVVDWPPCSPDLNPIENLWAILKERICKRYPELTYMPKTEESKQALIAAAVELWEEIEPEVIENLIYSMKRRMQAIVHAYGWYTKY